MVPLNIPKLEWQIQAGINWPIDPDAIRSVLVVHLMPLGDFVIVSPFLRNLRLLYPHSKITLVVQAICAQLAETCPYIDHVAVIKDIHLYPKDLRAPMAFGMELQNTPFAPFDLCLVPRYDHDHVNSGVLAEASNAAIRLGFGRACTDFKLKVSNVDVDTHYHAVALAPNGHHDVEYQLAMLQSLGANITSQQPLELWAKLEDQQKANAILEEIGWKAESFVVFGLGSGQAMKIWGIEKFCQLAARIHQKYGLNILVVGGTDYEIEMGAQLMAYMGPDKAHSVVGQINARASYALIAASRAVVTVDSYQAHAGAAARRPVCVVYSSPADCPLNDMFHPSRIHPWQTQYRYAQPATCGPIEQILASHVRSPHCINAVTVDQVWEKVQELL